MSNHRINPVYHFQNWVVSQSLPLLETPPGLTILVVTYLFQRRIFMNPQYDISANQPTRKSCQLVKTARSSCLFLALALNASISHAGAFDNALSFDGLNALSSTGDYVSLPPLSGITSPPFTIEAWVKPNGSQTQWASIVASRLDNNMVCQWPH
jgi:hypothetical protein